MRDAPQEGSGRWRWIVPPLVLAGTAAVTAALALLVLDAGSGEDPAAPATPPSPTTVATATPSVEPTAIAAAEGAAATAAATPAAQATATASVAAPASPTPTRQAQPTATLDARRDYPDLVVREAYSRLNQLVVVIANAGNADADGLIEVSIDGGPPHQIDTGKALRPGDLLEYPIEGQYVQRRGQVVVNVQPSAAIVERNAGNNVFVGVVTPDVPNDIAVIDVTYGGSGPHLIVTLRNRSPIPLRGEVTIAIRETTSEDRLILRETRALQLERGATQPFGFPDITTAPLESLQVIISTDAIDDADASNNSLPRWGPR